MDTIEEILYQLDEGDNENEKENEKENENKNEEQLILPLEETPTGAEMDPTSLTLEITENFSLIRFELDAIRKISHRPASIDITIFGDDGKQFCRTFFLCGHVVRYAADRDTPLTAPVYYGVLRSSAPPHIINILHPRLSLSTLTFVSLDLTRALQPSHHFSLFGPRSTVTVLGRSQ
jgi:hypothetical protein